MVIREPEWVHFAAFEDDHQVLEAVEDCRERGLDVVDVFGPYPIHGIERSMGLKRSRLTWACFFFGLTGLLFALWLQYWTSAEDWPLNVGGKPFNSLPAFVPVAFELTVLFAGLGTVATFLIWARLYPGKKALTDVPGVTDDQFIVVLKGKAEGVSREALHDLLRQHGATKVWNRLRETSR